MHKYARTPLERSSGRIYRVTDPAGREFVYTYDTTGRLESCLDAAGDMVSYSYTGDQMAQIIKADGSRIQYFYRDLDGRTVMDYNIDENGGIEYFDYYPEEGYHTYTDRAGRTEKQYFDNRMRTIKIDQYWN